MAKIRRAVISVFDKSGISELARELHDLGVEILSTGGTSRAIKDAGVPVKDVSEYTGFPEMMDGRVKTLHPKIHGGLLARRSNNTDLADMQRNGIEFIDLVVVNLYPFERVISKEGVTFADAIENIDIGGPTMLRAAAKNFEDVVVVVDPRDYYSLVMELKSLHGEVSYPTRARLARKVFEHTSRYDSIIHTYLRGVAGEDALDLPDTFTPSLRMVSALRYGENPHQKAAAYSDSCGGLSLFNSVKFQGKDMSFNNYSDAHCALMLAGEFESTACVIVKHNSPCGVAIAPTTLEAYTNAVKTDPISAYGGVIAFNVPIDESTATEITKTFVEVILAPGYSAEALRVFTKKPSIRVIEMRDMHTPCGGYDIKRVAGGLLVQEWDTTQVDVRSLRAVTRRVPTDEEFDALEFAWTVAKHVRTNAIVYALGGRTLGIGIGQTSRVYATRVGAINALEPLKGCVVASDGFFPFSDSIEAIKRVGATAIIHPGGSVNDEDVIRVANEMDIAMLITGLRHFKY